MPEEHLVDRFDVSQGGMQLQVGEHDFVRRMLEIVGPADWIVD